MNGLLEQARHMEPKLLTAANRFLVGNGHTALSAEDLVQECFLKLIKHGGRFQRSKSSETTFIYTVFRNRACQLISRTSPCAHRNRHRLDPD